MPLPYRKQEGPKDGQPLNVSPCGRILNRRRFLAGAAAGALAITSRRQVKSTVKTSVVRAPLNPVNFTNITQAAGLSLVQKRGGCGMFYYVEQEAAGAALFDADGDGYLDIYSPQPNPLGVCKPQFKETLRHHLYLNNRDGTFRLAPNAFKGVETDYGIAAAVGDYDNDGRPDLFVACYGRRTRFRNLGNSPLSG